MVPAKGLPEQDQGLSPPAGSLDRELVSVSLEVAPVKEQSADKDRLLVPWAGLFEQGLASLPHVGVFHLRCHGTLSATLRPDHYGTCYKNSGHNVDQHGGRANRDISAKKSAHIGGVGDTRYSISAHTSKPVLQYR